VQNRGGYQLWRALTGLAGAVRRSGFHLGLRRHDPAHSTQHLQLATLIDSLPDGVIAFGSDGGIILCNARYREIYDLEAGWPPPRTPSQDISNLQQRAADMPGIPIERRDPADQSTRLADGRIIALERRAMEDGAWIEIHKDITEQEALRTQLSAQLSLVEQQKKQLRLQNFQFDTALNNISQGLCFFDGARRLIICNSRYIDMYDLAPQSVYPGMTLQDIIDLRYQAGSCPAMTKEAYLIWRDQIAVSDTPTDTVVELMNGRVFEIHHRPMPDGGWVATHADITAQRLAEARIAHMAHHDHLTGLANRALLNQRLEAGLTAMDCSGTIALHLIDLDHFKTVNDTLGHPAGDLLLMSVADRLRSVAGEGDLIARMGGDEFAIMQVNVICPEDAVGLAARIIDAVCFPYDLDGHPASIGASVGIALGRSGGARDQLVRNADLALYGAKAAGRSAYRLFDERTDRETRRATARA
jgi:diguanylate cyclase (GGDEF)-like protein